MFIHDRHGLGDFLRQQLHGVGGFDLGEDEQLGSQFAVDIKAALRAAPQVARQFVEVDLALRIVVRVVQVEVHRGEQAAACTHVHVQVGARHRQRDVRDPRRLDRDRDRPVQVGLRRVAVRGMVIEIEPAEQVLDLAGLGITLQAGGIEPEIKIGHRPQVPVQVDPDERHGRGEALAVVEVQAQPRHVIGEQVGGLSEQQLDRGGRIAEEREVKALAARIAAWHALAAANEIGGTARQQVSLQKIVDIGQRTEPAGLCQGEAR